MIKFTRTFTFIVIIMGGYSLLQLKAYGQGVSGAGAEELRIEQNEKAGTISVFRSGSNEPVLTQHSGEGVRPYIHPIVAPDGKGSLTEYRPKHHLHQTGLYWGLKEVNGRDFFMNWQEDYWRRVSVEVIEGEGQEVKWQTVYDMLGGNGETILTETQTWAVQERNGQYVLDLQWEGEARTDVTLGEFYVGGLFLRMPWHKGINGEVVNAVGQINAEAEGQRAIWTDVGIQLPGRDDMAHIAIFDHPDNKGFPTPWRVDNELGVGPSIQILGDREIKKGERETTRYRLLAYTGARSDRELDRDWKEFVCTY